MGNNRRVVCITYNDVVVVNIKKNSSSLSFTTEMKGTMFEPIENLYQVPSGLVDISYSLLPSCL